MEEQTVQSSKPSPNEARRLYMRNYMRDYRVKQALKANAPSQPANNNAA